MNEASGIRESRRKDSDSSASSLPESEEDKYDPKSLAKLRTIAGSSKIAKMSRMTTLKEPRKFETELSPKH